MGVLSIMDACIETADRIRVAMPGQFGASEYAKDVRNARAAVAELMAAAEDARSALHSCIDALSSDEQSDHDALARVTTALASMERAA